MKLLTIFFLTFAGINVSANAFTLNNSAKLVFAKDEITVNVAGGNCAYSGISDDEMLAIVGDAVDKYWNTSPTSRLKLRKGNVVSVSSDYHSEPICVASTNCTPNPALAVASGVLISCNDNASNFPNGSILGLTIPNNISGSTILGSLILINDTSSTQFDSKSRDEKVAIIAHELGHTFGLGHSPVTDSLMYYATMAQRKALGRDDIDGISYLYPKQQPIAGCGTVDFNAGNGKGPDFWPGLFIGFFIIGLAELYRKKKYKSLKTCT